MFEKGETIILADTFDLGTILEVRDGTYLVRTDAGNEVEVSEFDVIPYESDDDFDLFVDDDDYDDFEDLQPYRNMNQGYY